MTFIPSLSFTDYEWFPGSICNGCGMPAGNAYHSGHLGPSPLWGLACALIVETSLIPRLYIDLMTYQELTFTEFRGFHRAFATGVACQQGALTLPDIWFRPPIVGLACAPIVETRFLELAMSLLDFSPRILLGTFRFCFSIFHLLR